MTDTQMRHEIMNQIVCTSGSVTSDTWFSLAFATTDTLRKICREIGIAA